MDDLRVTASDRYTEYPSDRRALHTEELADERS